MNRVIEKIKYIKWGDIGHLFLFLFALLPAFFLKRRKPQFWLICEDENEARDNGYWLYKYICEQHPEQKVVYAINKQSPDYKKVEELGEVISYGSFTHWIYYLAAEVNISSQKGGKPNAAVCYLLEVYGVLKNKRVFLQHGITKDDAEWLYYKNTKMRLFVCAAQPEYEFVKAHFGYPDNNIAYLGFTRYDALHDIRVKKNRILIMPTWRKWIADEDERTKRLEGSLSFEESEYFTRWSAFLESSRLEKIVKENSLEIIFFPHRNMQRYLEAFMRLKTPAIIADWKEWEIQDLLKTSALMITDYSSVFFDFIYMKKPVIFYQFDYEKFRENQYAEGYFDYKDNPFGVSCSTQDQIFDQWKLLNEKQYKIDETFSNGYYQYFKYDDKDNCKRTFEKINSL